MNYVTDDYLNNYLRTVQPHYDGVLGEIEKESRAADVPIIPHETARLLSVLLTLKKPKNILEIGTAVGFSSGLMTRYLEEGGTVTTIDSLEDKIKILEGDAADILPELSGPYDVIFLDAAKGQYSAFLPHCIRLLNIGGLLIVDDVLQGGDIAKTRFAVPRRQRTIHKRLKNFLWDISHTDVLTSSIVPIGDGLAVCVKVKEPNSPIEFSNKESKDE